MDTITRTKLIYAIRDKKIPLEALYCNYIDLVIIPRGRYGNNQSIYRVKGWTTLKEPPLQSLYTNLTKVINDVEIYEGLEDELKRFRKGV